MRNIQTGEILINSDYDVTYTLKRPDKRIRDLGNYEKALSDWLVDNGIIKDDSHIHRLTIQWGDFDAPEWAGVKCEIKTI